MSGNVPIVFPVTPILDDWQPRAHLIADVTTDETAVVTTTEDNGYEDGMWVRIFVPREYGMVIPYVQSIITVLTADSFMTSINTTALLPFIAPTFPLRFTPAQVTVVSGRFKNIARSNLS